MAFNKDDFLTALDSMSVMELNDLVKAIEEKFGVSAAAMAAPAAGGGGAAPAAAEEKTEFTVQLMRRKALLGRSGHVEGNGPMCERRVATLHHALGLDRVVLAAIRLCAAIAAPLLGRVELAVVAMGAYRPFRPAGGFKPRPGGFLIVKVGGCKFRLIGHGVHCRFEFIEP